MQLDATTLKRLLDARLLDVPDLPAGGARGVRFHSDRVRPGDAFVAMAGSAVHGERYADEALARGAAFVISDRPRPGAVLVDDAGAALLDLGRAARAARRGPVIGVTGSVGKTTAKALLAAALDAAVSPGNLNTPHALATVLIDAWLAGDIDRPLVLELGIDHVGEMARLVDLVRPTDALLTALAPAHLAGLRDLATVAREKAHLLTAASGARVVADPAYDLLPAGARHEVIRYRLAASAADEAASPDVPGRHAVGRHSTGRHLAGDPRDPDPRDRLELTRASDTWTVSLPGVGRALAENALGAWTLATALGVPPALAAERLATARLEPHRLEVHRLDGWTLLDDTYNASPASMREALEVLRRLPAPHGAVLGAMLELGSEAPAHHEHVGRACAALGLDPVWAVGAAAAPLAAACPGARHLPDAAAAVAARGALPRRGTLLVKGSRGIGLERLVDALLAPRAVVT